MRFPAIPFIHEERSEAGWLPVVPCRAGGFARGRSSAGAPRAAGAHPALPAPGESLLLLSHSDLINKKWVTHAEASVRALSLTNSLTG